MVGWVRAARMNVKNTSKKFKNRRFILFFVAMVITVTAAIFLKNTDVYSPGGSEQSSEKEVSAEFNKRLYPLDDPASLWVVVNKGRRLPNSYEPYNLVAPNVSLRFSAQSPEMMLRSDAAAALKELFEAAEVQGLPLILTSGYRSYTSQTTIYNRNVARDGQVATDALSARPGHSEHQTGLAADVGSKTRKCEFEKCFGSLPEGQWVSDNAYKYGFIIRYQAGRTDITGYDFEPWHLRFVGTELARQLQETGQTMEQFFGLPAFAQYPSAPKLL